MPQPWRHVPARNAIDPPREVPSRAPRVKTLAPRASHLRNDGPASGAFVPKLSGSCAPNHCLRGAQRSLAASRAAIPADERPNLRAGCNFLEKPSGRPRKITSVFRMPTYCTSHAFRACPLSHQRAEDSNHRSMGAKKLKGKLGLPSAKFRIARLRGSVPPPY